MRGLFVFQKTYFVLFFGEWLYLFDFDLLRRNFEMSRYDNVQGIVCYSKGICRKDGINVREKLRFQSENLDIEWRIHMPIDVEAFSLGVIKHWNYSKGVIETMISDMQQVKRIKVDLYNGC